MAWPVIATSVSARIGPWIQRMGPGAWKAASEALSKAGVMVRNPSELMAYLANNKLATASVLSTLASSGYAVSDLFSPADKSSAEVREFVVELAQKEIQAMRERLVDNAASSQALEGLSGNAQDLRLLRDVCRFARAHYGSVESAKKAFLMHQAFFELSEEDLETGMELLV